MRLLDSVIWLAGLGACGFPAPAELMPSDAGVTSDAGTPDGPAGICAPGQPLRCDGSQLVRCNGDGTAEVTEACMLGCNGGELRCNEMDPSNRLAPFLDMTAGEPDINLGAMATINTDSGEVQVDGQPVVVRHATIDQPSAPTIRVFIVSSLVAANVTVTGTNAFAIVSSGEIKIEGALSVSARSNISGPGSFSDSLCQGKNSIIISGVAISGTGGGGFGTRGASGGSATNMNGTAAGGSGGDLSGNPELVPLRGGCHSGALLALVGGGGGVMQLVSRTRIAVGGVLAANGASRTGGGSGGGILLEAPTVDVAGNVVANGAGGRGCEAGEDGRLDATPAAGGRANDPSCGKGGNGAARNAAATQGASLTVTGSSANAGHGGGGVGRIRVNTVPNGLRVTGVFSPNPSTGVLATR